MKYFLVTRSNNCFGVTIPELLRCKRWREVKRQHLIGTLTITVRCDYNDHNVFFTKQYSFKSGRELTRIISNYSEYTVYRYGVDPVRGLVEVDIVKVR